LFLEQWKVKLRGTLFREIQEEAGIRDFGEFMKPWPDKET
jgi:hypothetical protein